MSTKQEPLDGMPPTPFTVEVSIAGSDRWLGLTRQQFDKMKTGKVYRLVLEAHVTTFGTKEKGEEEVEFVKLKADFIDTDPSEHDGLRSPPADIV